MKRETTSNRVLRRRCCATAVGVLLSLSMAGAAHAQMAVTDPGHTGFTYSGWMVQGEEYVKQADRWKKERDHYEQQLADAKKFFQAQGMAMTMDFSERPLDYGMSESCPDPESKPGPGGASSFTSFVNNTLSGISAWRPLGLDKSADLKTDMLELCAQIIATENKKYNETVRLLKNIKQRDDELEGLDGYRRGVGTHQGRLATSNNQLSAFAARTQMDLQYTETVIKTYNEHIANLRQAQALISKRILEGGDKTAVVSALLQGATLKGALAGIRAVRDR